MLNTKTEIKSKIKKKQFLQKTELLDAFIGKEGIYTGSGINHENHEFRGHLELKRIINNKGIEIKYNAIGIEGTELNKANTLFNENTILYSEENTIIAYDSENKLCLWTLNSNIPSMVKFDLRRYREIAGKKHIFIFGFGDPDENVLFREEISIELSKNEITYSYSWGQADGMFISHSTATMKKVKFEAIA